MGQLTKDIFIQNDPFDLPTGALVLGLEKTTTHGMHA